MMLIIMSDIYELPKTQDLEKVVVPVDTDFYEEMSLFIYLAQNYPDEVDVYLSLPAS